MKTVLFKYFGLVLGIPFALSIIGLIGGEGLSIKTYIETVLFFGAFLGPLPVGGYVGHMPITHVRKTLISFIISIVLAGLIAGIYCLLRPEDAQQFIIAGWGDNQENYKTYPIRRYQLVGVGMFVIYFIMSSSWSYVYRNTQD